MYLIFPTWAKMVQHYAVNGRKGHHEKGLKNLREVEWTDNVIKLENVEDEAPE